MRGSRNARSWWLSLVALLAVLALIAAACGGDEEDGGGATGATGEETESPTEEPEEPVTLQWWLFGNFDEEAMIAAYQEDHPNVTIETTVAEYNDHHDALTTAIAAGAGAPDIAVIEVGFMSRFLAQPDNFYNLLDFGAGELEGNFLDWKWNAGLTGDGSSLIALGTDIGPMAMAYRTDLFEEAGLPTEREEVSALWPTWEDFIAVGEQYVEATGRAFTDEDSQLYNPVLNQTGEKYYSPENELIYDSNPTVRGAWDLTCDAIDAGIFLNVEPFSTEWNAPMTNGDFATLTAPSWMMGYIKGQAPDTEGLWDLAALPGGGGNWGGSFLAIPAQSENAQAAYDFIEWYTAPEQQLTVFQDVGNFPSAPSVYGDIGDLTDPFFNDAPYGQIYAAVAEANVPIYEGPDEGVIRSIFESALDRVSNGEESCEEGWNSALDEIQRDVG
jgi:cellobiose transport system substrate-binding protein